MAKKKLLEQIEPLIGERSVYDLGGDEWGALLFDWEELPAAFRREFVAEIFGDCEVPGDFPEILEAVERGGVPMPSWKADSPWVPFGLANVQDDDVELSAGEGFAEYPQFDQLLVVNVNEIEGDTVPVYAIDVDGTAIPAPAPEPFADDLADLDFRV
jgi:hypothetical protein